MSQHIDCKLRNGKGGSRSLFDLNFVKSPECRKLTVTDGKQLCRRQPPFQSIRSYDGRYIQQHQNSYVKLNRTPLNPGVKANRTPLRWSQTTIYS